MKGIEVTVPHIKAVRLVITPSVPSMSNAIQGAGIEKVKIRSDTWRFVAEQN
jgi:hypothetical protein